jgi:hypothetical protein
MRKLRILAIATSLAVSGPAGAVINNGGGVKSAPCADSDGNGVCQEWCHLHNIYAKSQQICDRRCWVSYCKSPAPFTTGKPVNGKPVQAPPPPSKGGKGGRPINAAPVIYGGSKAPPSSGGGTQTILERGSGGRH